MVLVGFTLGLVIATIVLWRVSLNAWEAKYRTYLEEEYRQAE
nr:hypothetical protein [Exiguobacterium sp. SL14]